MKHIVYSTTHVPSQRYYIGIHSTKKIDDGYLGSGIKWLKILKAHPKTDFERKIVATCKTRNEARRLEAMIVQPFLLDRKLFPRVCNLVAGGDKGTGLWSQELKDRVKIKQRESQGTPEARADKSTKMKAFYAKPENRERQSRISSECNNRPDVKAKMRLSTKAIWQREGHREKASAGIKASWADPVARAKRTEGLKLNTVKRQAREAAMSTEEREALRQLRAEKARAGHLKKKPRTTEQKLETSAKLKAICAERKARKLALTTVN